MNKLRVLTDETDLITRALDALRVSAGIHGQVLLEADGLANAAVVLPINEKRLRYICEVKKKVDRHALPLDLLNRLDNITNTLLVSSPLSQEMANRCRELGIQFMDTAGNTYIHDGRGIYIYVTGLRGHEERQAAASGATITPAALKMMFAFLADPLLLNAPYRDIAFRAMVSTGAIGKVFEMLETRSLIGHATGGKRMIRNPELFLNEWASGFNGRLKPKLKKYRFTTDNLDEFLDWHPRHHYAAWGGEAGAMRLTKHLQPEEATLYVDVTENPQALRDIVRRFRLRADPNGRIEIVQMFWNSDHFTEWSPMVPPHLIYADLMATHDPRNIAVARKITSIIIDHVHDSTP